MKKTLLVLSCIVALVIVLPGCKKALTEGPESHTNPLDPKSPDYTEDITIVIDGIPDAAYGASIGSGANIPSGCPTSGLDIKKVFVVDSVDYWHFLVELSTTPPWTAIAGDRLAIYLEWAPGGAINGFESPAAGNHTFTTYDPEGVIFWDIMTGGINYHNTTGAAWNPVPAQILNSAGHSFLPMIAPLGGNLEVRLPKSVFAGGPPPMIKVMVFSYHTDLATITSWDAVPSQGYTECWATCCPNAVTSIALQAARN